MNERIVPGASAAVLAAMMLGLAAAETMPAAADWPQWRGPGRNGVAEGSPPLVDTLPAQGFAPLWTSEEDFSDGGGWSSPVVADGRVVFYTHRQQLKAGAKPPAAQYPPLADDKKAAMAPQEFDAYEELRVEEQLTRLREFFDQSDAIHCLDAATGKTLWNHLRPSGPTRWRQSSTPAVAGGRVFYLGADRAMNCLDATDGRLLWTTPLPFAPDSEEPMVSSPVVVGDVVVACAGRLLAYDVASGRIAWQGDAATTRGIYSSPSVWRSAAGTRLVANVAKGKTVCVESDTGRLLWSVDTFSERSSPTVVGDLLVTYGGSRKGGVRCHRLSATGAELLWNNQQLSDAGSSACVTDGLVFVQGGGSLVCLGLDDGRERWRQPIAATDPRYTSPVTADGRVFFAGEGLMCVRAAADEPAPLFDACMRADGRLLSRATVRADLGIDELERTSAGQEKAAQLWQREVVRPGPLKCVTPALAAGRVYIRTASRVVCYDLAKDRAADRRPPNILLIFTDDQPYKTVGCYPEAPDWVRTPHIDRLAATGVRFERAYLGAWCMPSRASLLTGKLQHGIESMRMAGTYPGSTYDPAACPFIPAQFRKRGYHTAQIGKWHTGTDAGFGRDWDHQVVWNRPKLPENAGAYYEGQILSFDGEERRVEGYSTDIYTDLACGYIRGDRRPTDRPWYLWLCYGAVHGPTTPAERHAGACADRDVPVPVDIFGPRPDKPGYLDATQAWDPGPDGTPVMRRRRKSSSNFDADLPGRSHAAWVRQVNECAMAIDEGVGRLLAALEESGQLADTLVVFTSDQGFALGEHGLSVKLAPYDAAIASPLIISRPGTLPAGVVRSRPVNAADVAATLCRTAGVDIPWPHHGRDFGDLLADAPEAPSQQPMLLTNTGRLYGSDTDSLPIGDAMFEQSGVPWWVMLRDGRHKYVRTLVSGEVEEVYDLEADPEELENLAVHAEHRPLLERLRAATIAELRRTGAGFITAMPPTRDEQAARP